MIDVKGVDLETALTVVTVSWEFKSDRHRAATMILVESKAASWARNGVATSGSIRLGVNNVQLSISRYG